jgi:hypothetical protein
MKGGEEKMDRRGLAIGILNRGHMVGPGKAVGSPVALEWALCWSAQEFPSNMNRKVFIDVSPLERDAKRNAMAQRAIDGNYKFLWFLDDDVAVPPMACRKLIYDLQRADDDVMVAAGIYGTKQTPSEPTIYDGNNNGSYMKWKRDEIIDIPDLRVATGCMVIKVELFDHLEKPYFKDINEGSRIQTDDLYFCDKVRAAGFRCIADSSILGIHWDMETNPPTPYRLEQDVYYEGPQ